ncbi:MAG: hypothetical protein GY724_00925 [Actinomycetia bacterium]|nr:hypothetical protein [Actinomycetes bacterium]MCP5035245.1 hypothetical protein [Actinomycetes bacterium]
MARDDSDDAEAGEGAKFYPLVNDTSGSSPFDLDTFRIVDDPNHGKEWRIDFDHIHYKSDEKYVGSDNLIYEICTFDEVCVTATVSIDVTP